MSTAPNPQFALAAEMVNYTQKHVFLTGKAGTGKTTFLRHIKNTTHKNTAVVAPTGVAAINAGGSTLHSLLQLPFGMYIPNEHAPLPESTTDEYHNRHSLLRKVKISNKRRKMIQALELLIIDEVSMVRADLLDMADTLLRYVRKQPALPFGGLQLLYIGDMFQLPPVVREADRPILAQYYKSPYFFDAKVIQQAPPVYLELTTVYRQRDESFVTLLNQVRNNCLDAAGLQILTSRYLPHFEAPKGEQYITLTTHNYQADNINGEALNRLGGKPFVYKAEVQGDFPQHMYPIDEQLKIKAGAQVMFVKNDQEKRYYNGKIGLVTEVDNETIKVQCKGETETIDVPKEVWRNIRYTYDKNNREVTEEELGTFTQYPLRLAWAITVHKSQGLTFEKAIIDAGKSFEAGQVYVALSRCTSLEGMVLRSALSPQILFTNERIAQFGSKDRMPHKLPALLEAEKQKYLQEVLTKALQLQQGAQYLRTLLELNRKLPGVFHKSAEGWFGALPEKIQYLQNTHLTLAATLPTLLAREPNPEQNTALQAWLQKEMPHLYSEIHKIIWLHWRQRPYPREEVAKKALEEMLETIGLFKDWIISKLEGIEKLKKGFKLEEFFKRQPYTYPGAPAKDTATAEKNEAPPARKDKKKTLNGSALQSLEMLQSGMNLMEIAETRLLATSTIASHLGTCIGRGLLQPEALLPADKIAQIDAAIATCDATEKLLSNIKEKLGDDFSYHEINWVMAWHRKQAANAEAATETADAT